MTASPVKVWDANEIEAFLVHEARLLDERRYEEWLDLFTEQAWYWVPLQENQADPKETVSLMYDDRRLLETRVRRLVQGRLHAQEPKSRTSRMVTNVTIEARDDAGATVRSKFIMTEYRRGVQITYAGTYLHGLVRQGGQFRIAWKRVDIVNSEDALPGLVVPF
ncbi:MAG TPA: aromatic-ring-hydroxylating dioxygenase subunit beta [Alphaproteobacteria bacterium]|jgi:benzoate/toluate 1,2-dioxygenase beta subunit